MPKKKNKAKKSSRKKDDQKLFAFLATFLSIVGFVIALIMKREDKYVIFYAKQSLIVFIIYLIAKVVEVLPFIGEIISPIVYIASLLFWVISWVNALSGKMKEIPLIGVYARKISL